MTPRWAASSMALALMAFLAGCAEAATPSEPGGDQPVELTVFAASSLTGAFTDLGANFEAVNAGVNVIFNFGPSDGLAGQIQSEGTADVFASASPKWMDAVASDPGVESRADFARNRLVVITPVDDPSGIASITDLAEPGVQLVLAAEGVPVGDYSREALDNAGILDAAVANIVSNEEDVAAVVGKIAAGEADAAIAYASDISAAAANDVRAVEIPDDLNVVATYPIAVVTGTDQAELAAAFVSFVKGSDGLAMLERFGFLAPA